VQGARIKIVLPLALSLVLLLLLFGMKMANMSILEQADVRFNNIAAYEG
jgi:hypothetical protein